MDFVGVRLDAAATLAKLAGLPGTHAMSHKGEGGEPRAVANFHLGQATFFSGDYMAAANALNASVDALNKWWEPRLVVPGGMLSRQDRADAAEIELFRVHALARAERRQEAQIAFAPVKHEIETLHSLRPDLFITQRLVARMLWIRTEIETELPATEKRTLLEQARQIYRAADREKRLNRIQREIILPEIEKTLAAIAGRATQ